MTRLTVAQIETVAGILAEASVREIMPRFRRLSEESVRMKTGPLDLVTDADEAAEQWITQALLQQFPSALVVGEEAATKTPSLLDALGDADLAFVVDPVDGTSNFAAGLTLFGCMAAVLSRGEIIATIIHDPVGCDTAFALRGEGAWISFPDGMRQDLRVAASVPVAAMTGAASWRFLAEPLRSSVCEGMAQVAQSFDFRCAAHEYRMLAGGYCHFLLFNRLMPWDHAPGVLLHQEAGGYSAQFDGRPYSPLRHGGGLLCTPDAESWHLLAQALLGQG
ncbi:Inositol monophosphatase and related sulfite synthesis enzyme [Granulibacter bethesdensis]|uniref:Inositol monophosphatase and related sulfite synthesis enzyme n=1 Tax=Granulibacter bethesdensis TaxID=364410 RepID=A0AAC9KE39_9PROT|nr:inositol monophosphatase family protein [Granulibacter bethesdensis]APH54405.1 Inositol monophosphatase and related sulfite synthesis enzyme [Granulibacter bethesdensis]APH61990.1 Inositol monophosphatase and related sulfite synthesis enzyme [Granulibacter bethesdensis]